MSRAHSPGVTCESSTRVDVSSCASDHDPLVVADPDHRRSDCGQRARRRRLQGQDHLRRRNADQRAADPAGQERQVPGDHQRSREDRARRLALPRRGRGERRCQECERRVVRPAAGQAEREADRRQRGRAVLRGREQGRGAAGALRLRLSLRRLPPGSAASADRADPGRRSAVRRRRSARSNRRRHDPGVARRHQQPRSRSDRRARHQDLAVRVAGPGDAGRPVGRAGNRHPDRAVAEPLRSAGAPRLRSRAARHRRLRGDARGPRWRCASISSCRPWATAGA